VLLTVLELLLTLTDTQGLGAWLKLQSACLASSKPWVQNASTAQKNVSKGIQIVFTQCITCDLHQLACELYQLAQAFGSLLPLRAKWGVEKAGLFSGGCVEVVYINLVGTVDRDM
jgi:hypothetical protein